MASGWLLHNTLLFVRLLRELGLPIDTRRSILLGQAMAQVGVADRDDFYHAARSCLIYRQQDLAAFDRAFRAFWRSRTLGGIPLSIPGRPRRRDQAGPATAPTRGWESGGADQAAALRYSAAEALRQRDFADLDPEEQRAIQALIRRLAWRLEEHLSRRYRLGDGRLPDPRRTFRSGLRYGGELLVWELRRPKGKPRPLVLLADISGSMEPYTRILLQFLYSLTHGLAQPLEAFVFGTRLTRISNWLRLRDAEQALRRVSLGVPDWSGGTRIGESLRQFNLHWARRVLSRGAVVIIISDGLDRGQPALLRGEIARLQRSCRRLIWLNPLLGSLDYEPVALGMRTALPFVDDFLPAHNLASLEGLADQLSGTAAHRQIATANHTAPAPGAVLPSITR